MKSPLTLVLVICLWTNILSQNSTGNVFWLGYMENLTLDANDAPRFVIFVDADVRTNGIIEVPSTGLSILFTAEAGILTEVELPQAIWYSIGSETVDGKGIRIETDNPVRINAFHFRAFFSESTNLLPETVLGEAYMVNCYRDVQRQSPTSFVVVSTEDDNTIEITPTAITSGLRPPGVPFTITLNRGQNYQVQAAEDLTGSTIRSLDGKKLAVFSGARQANAGSCPGANADNHLYDQCLPLNLWETDHYFVPFQNQGGDIIKIVSASDDVDIFFDCELQITLDRGQSFTVKRNAPTVITATSPIAVAQINESQSCNASTLGDPNMLWLLPAGYRSNSHNFQAPGDFNPAIGSRYFEVHYVNIIAPTDAVSNITLDGNNIGNSFSPFPANRTQSFAQIPILPGAHQIEATEPVAAYSYGFGNFDAYSTHLGFSAPQDIAFECLRIEVEGENCVDSILQFRPISSLNLVSYQWDFGNGQTSTLEAPTIKYGEVGTYQVTLITFDVSGRQLTAELIIDIEDCSISLCPEDIFVDIEVNGEFCLDSMLTFRLPDTLTLSNFNWFFDNGNESNEPIPFVTYTSPGTYTITLEAFDDSQCRYVGVKFLEIEDCTDPESCQIQFPNAFTPNEDGRNDEFKVISNCTLTDFNLQIFNRWGELVFQTNDPTQGWNGRQNGSSAVSDVYVYLARYSILDLETQTQSGDITLIR